MATGSDQFISEVRIFPFQSVPSGWLPCEGQLLSIKDPAYQAIFSLIRNIYGGDGVNTFALPNFRGVVPTGTGNAPNRTSRAIGETGGKSVVTLGQDQIPTHQHTLAALGVAGNASGPRANTFARSLGANIYASAEANVGMSTGAISLTGGNLPHDNMQPYLALNFCIAYEGAFPR